MVRVAVAVVRRQNLLLICRRKPDTVLADFWEFPGGKILPGESAERCAVREVFEELGIQIESNYSLEPSSHSYPHGLVHLTPVVCTYLSGQPRPIGCSEFRWILPAELSGYRFPPANASLLEYLVKQDLLHQSG
jgi:mutator protein MutT